MMAPEMAGSRALSVGTEKRARRVSRGGVHEAVMQTRPKVASGERLTGVGELREDGGELVEGTHSGGSGTEHSVRG